MRSYCYRLCVYLLPIVRSCATDYALKRVYLLPIMRSRATDYALGIGLLADLRGSGERVLLPFMRWHRVDGVATDYAFHTRLWNHASLLPIMRWF